MNHKEIAEKILKCTREFEKGCSRTQRALVSTDCEECTRAFVAAVQRVILEEASTR